MAAKRSDRRQQRRPHPHIDITHGLYKRQGPWSPIANFFGPAHNNPANAARERKFLIRAGTHAKKKRSWVRLGRKHGWL